mgnify:CR=1 FL=1
MATTIHMGFSVRGLHQLISEGALQPDVLEESGRPIKSRSRALTHLALLSQEGKTTLSGCPTPDVRGACPGH